MHTAQGPRLRAASLAFAGFVVLSNPTVYAADEPEPVGIETITVTGSRIARATGEESPTPMTVVTAELIDLSGQINLGEYLNELPQLRSTMGLQNSGGNIGTVGLNLLDLRGLGDNRTLVLVDGKRHIGAYNGTTSVDINSIPSELVDRVEITTGGASAIYGADAVTGVVNFILKDNFDGFRMTGYGSKPVHNGGEESEVSATFGRNFADDQGNVVLSYSHTSDSQVKGTDRSWIKDEWGSVFNPANTGFGDGIPESIFLKGTRNNLLNTNGVIWGPHPVEDVFGGGPADTAFFGLPSGPYTFTNDGTLKPFGVGQTFTDPNGFTDSTSVGGDGLAFAPTEQLFPHQQRDNFYSRVRYEFNEHLTVRAQGTYSKTESKSYGQPAFDYFGGLFIAPDNAFISPALQTVLNNDGATEGFFLNRFHNDLGLRGDDIDRQTFYYVLSADGDITGSWRYETSAVYGLYNGDAKTLNNRNNQRFFDAVDAVDDGSGNIVCRSVAAQAAGCVPLDLFGYGLSDPAAIKYINEPNSNWSENMDQTVLTASVTGNAYELPAGPIQVAIGAEYRKETSKVHYSAPITSGETFFNALADTNADYDVKEGFVEAVIPILHERSWTRELDIDVAERWSDYNTIGNTDSWKWGVDWAVTQDVRFRLTRSKAVRSPNIGELFDPLQQNFFDVTDPCSDTVIPTAPDPALRLANCNALGKPAVYQSVNDNATIGGFSGGNPNLSEETSKSWTYGVVLTPRWVENLSLTVDYWNIKIDNAISAVDAQDILNKCVDAPSIDNIYCPLVVRDASFDLDPVAGITQTSLNIASLEAKGIDYELNYLWDMSATFDRPIGSVNFNVVGMHLTELKNFDFAGDPSSETDIKGLLGDPKDQFNVNTTYHWGNVTANWRFRYLDEMRLVSNEQSSELQHPYKTNVQTYHDVQLRYLFADAYYGDFDVYAGVNNLMDEAPQKYLSGSGSQSAIYDTLGRTFYVGVVFDLQKAR
jgi:iron complex outermembrane recepter protein